VTAKTTFRRVDEPFIRKTRPVKSGVIPVGDRLVDIQKVDYLRFLSNESPGWQRDIIARQAYRAEQIAPLAGYVFLEMISSSPSHLTRIESRKPTISDVESCLLDCVGEATTSVFMRCIRVAGTSAIIESRVGERSFIKCDENVTVEASVSPSFIASFDSSKQSHVLVFDGVIESASSVERILGDSYTKGKSLVIYCRSAPVDLLSSVLQNNRKFGNLVCIITSPSSNQADICINEMKEIFGESFLNVDVESLPRAKVSLFENMIELEIEAKESISNYLRRLKKDMETIQDPESQKFAMSRVQKLSSRKAEVCVGRDVFGDASCIVKDRFDASLRLFTHMRSHGVASYQGTLLPANSIAVAHRYYKSMNDVMIGIGGAIELYRPLQGDR
jgi:hypothetical protein